MSDGSPKEYAGKVVCSSKASKMWKLDDGKDAESIVSKAGCIEEGE